MTGHIFRSGNPSLNKNTFQSFSVTSENKMTLMVLLIKLNSLLLLMITATYTWNNPSMD